MKWLIVAAACLAACVAVPLKEGDSIPVLKGANETLPEPALNKSQSHHRVRRECSFDDLGKLQAKLTYAVEQEFEKLLKSGSLPAANRTRRAAATSAAAGSVATPDGKVKSTAVTKGNSSGTAESAPIPAPEAGEPKTVPILESDLPGAQGNDTLPPPSHEGHEEGLPGLPGAQPNQPAPAGLPGAQPGQPAPVSGPVAVSGLTIQKVKAVASKENGTAVSSAVAKRDVSQDISAVGDKAISKAESHKGGDSHLQNVASDGGHLGIATANIDGKNNLTKSGADNTLQNVKASGDKAVATAAKKTDGGNTVQGAIAEGGQLSIASVSSGSEEAHPDPSKIVKRSVCLPDEINDNIRLLIRTTIENAFASFKQDMHHP